MQVLILCKQYQKYIDTKMYVCHNVKKYEGVASLQMQSSGSSAR